MSKAKRNTLLLLIGFGLLVLFVAMSLPTLKLSPGQPFTLEQPQLLPFSGSNPLPGGDLAILVIRGFLALALILLPFSLVYALMTPDGRRRLLTYAVLIVLLFIFADYLRNRIAENPPPEETLLFGTRQDPLPGSSVPTAVFTPAPPPGLTVVVALVVSITIILLLLAVVFYVRRRNQRPPSPLQRLADEVQSAIESLHTGGDLKTTIIHCYQEMSRVVQAEKGLARQVAMTPREFEDQLIRKGLPSEAVKTLTELFEQVRYGNISADKREEDLALACLNSIVQACRSGATPA